MRRMVLLPLPLAPRRTNSSPSWTSSEVGLTTGWPPKLLASPSSRIDIYFFGPPE